MNRSSSSSRHYHTTSDNREKLQAMELFKATHLVKLELLSNATTIDSALNYIRNNNNSNNTRKDRLIYAGLIIISNILEGVNIVFR
jgi:hypothetical protein